MRRGGFVEETEEETLQRERNHQTLLKILLLIRSPILPLQTDLESSLSFSPIPSESKISACRRFSAARFGRHHRRRGLEKRISHELVGKPGFSVFEFQPFHNLFIDLHSPLFPSIASFSV